MIRAAIGLACLASVAGAAETDWHIRLGADPDQLGHELRQFFAENPDIVGAAFEAADEARRAAAAQPLRDEIAGDRARIAELAPRLFGTTPLGFGADAPRLTVTLFTVAGCADCAAAEADLRTATEAQPGLRVELRPAADTLADRVSVRLARTLGTEAMLDFRAAVPDGLADDTATLGRVLAALDLPASLMDDVKSAPQSFGIFENSQTAQALDLDTFPSYVLPGMLFRGWMPAVVLDKYLN